MTKEELRKKYTALRNQFSHEETEELSIAIANNTLSLPIWDYTNYHLFLSIENKKEIQTEFILHILNGKDKNIVISKSDFKEGSLSHYLLTDNTKLRVNSYGIPEPTNGFQVSESTIDVVFIPLLAYDKKGNRVGYGKGFYDRFLSQCPATTLKIGLSFFEPEETQILSSDLDIPLDYCITPSTTYKF